MHAPSEYYCFKNKFETITILKICQRVVRCPMTCDVVRHREYSTYFFVHQAWREVCGREEILMRLIGLNLRRRRRRRRFWRRFRCFVLNWVLFIYAIVDKISSVIRTCFWFWLNLSDRLNQDFNFSIGRCKM